MLANVRPRSVVAFEKKVLEWTNNRLARAKQQLAAKGLGRGSGAWQSIRPRIFAQL